MIEEQICPECNDPMENLGNVSGIVMTSYPAQWDEVHVCYVCGTRRTVRERGESKPVFFPSFKGFREV